MKYRETKKQMNRNLECFIEILTSELLLHLCDKTPNVISGIPSPILLSV
jgi:hypothetical protein